MSALVNKRAEIAGMTTRTEQQLGQFRADLVHLDATIRLIAQEMEPKTIPGKRIRQSDLWFEQGELLLAVAEHEDELVPRAIERTHAAVVLDPHAEVEKVKGCGMACRKHLTRPRQSRRRTKLIEKLDDLPF